jgi:LysR family hydrogen peroxide-inducible transcriptional activator
MAGDIACEKLIVMKEGHCLVDQVSNFCERRDRQPQTRFRSARLETIQALVSAGVGLSLIPAMAARNSSKEPPEYRPFQSPKPHRDIVVVWPKQRAPSRCANEFLRMIGARFVKSRR